MRWLLIGLLILGGCDAETAAEAPGPEVTGPDGAAADVAAGGPDVPDDVADAASEPPEVESDVRAPVEFCEGATGAVWDPVAGTRLDTFPDDFHTVPDPGTVTGLRVRMRPENAAWVAATPAAFVGLFTEIEELDGFGTSAGIILRFDGALGELPSGPETSTTAPELQLVALTADGPERVPFEVQLTDEGATAILWPMVPLRPATRHVAVLTRGHLAANGGCVAPSAALRAVLDGSAEHPDLAKLVPRAEEALQALELGPASVSAMALFTTQSVVEQSVAIAADIESRAIGWTGEAACETAAAFRVCERAIGASDYREGKVVKGSSPVAGYDLPVRVWLPLAGEGPFPVLFFGHGLGGAREQAERLAMEAAPLGLATVAIDAVAHGEHPAGASSKQLERIMAFFGISIVDLSLSALVLRDNWRQSTYDKLQVLRALDLGPDVDGDGLPDLDTSRMAYFGVSLGAIMGSELLALQGRFSAAILTVGGGRVATIISDAEQFQLVIDFMKPPGTTDGEVDRFFPLLQAIIDRGDAASWAPYVLHQRIPGAGEPPHLMMVNVIDDDTVPPGTNRMLARALGVPHVPPVRDPVGIIEVLPEAPVSGNLAGRTAGLYQLDLMTKSPGAAPTQATHGGVATSVEGIEQALSFLQGWLDGVPPPIIDPTL